jgi:predicted transposase/invertase (TIGR01784 family)
MGHFAPPLWVLLVCHNHPSMAKLIRFDWAIKKILRSKANFSILEGFLSELLKADIKILNILDSESNKETEDDKFNRVDILVHNEKDDLILIEIQVAKEYDFLSRLLYGSSKIITEHMKEGDVYKNVKKVYAIGIVYFDLGQGNDYVYHGNTHFRGIHLDDELQLNDKQKLLYKREKVQDLYPEYYTLKINQFNDIAKDTLDEWIYFLKNEEIKDEFHAQGLSEAREKLMTMKLPKEEQADYAHYLEDLHYQASMVDSSYGLGKIEGKIEGESIGLQKKAIEVARKMRSKGLDIKTIAEVTGLGEEEIAGL